MFAHQVVDDLSVALKTMATGSDCHVYKEHMSLCSELIKNSVCFHFGEKADIETMCFNQADVGKALFDGEYGENIKLPYDNCWFDYVDNRHPKLGDMEYRVIKRGVLLTKSKGARDNGFFLYVFNYFPRIKWVLSPIIYFISVTHDLNIKRIAGMAGAVIFRTNTVLALPLFPPAAVPIDQWEAQVKENSAELTFVNFALMLLNCRNITTENIQPSKLLNRKRRKKIKHPIFSYKTLVIKPTTKKHKSIPKHLWNNRIHLARGHFKTYTAEKPLFGKLIGRYWWQPHVRGQNKGGVIIKDYMVHQSKS